MAFEGLRSRWYARQLGSDADMATFRTLHSAENSHLVRVPLTSSNRTGRRQVSCASTARS